MVLLISLLSWSWNILQEALFSSDYFLSYPFYIGIFYPEGEPDVQPRAWAGGARRGGFAVDNHSFNRRRLVTGPISTRE